MDRAISRIHCKIIYEDGFYKKRPMSKQFLTFLTMTHPEIGEGSVGNKIPLPTSIYKKIYQYLKS